MLLGVDTHFSQGWNIALFDQAEAMGTSAIRDGISWTEIEKSPGVYDFTAWEAQSGRLDKSNWWRATNGLMVLDIKQALRELVHGNGRSQNPGIQAWIEYAWASVTATSRRSQQAALWHAHQVSLHNGMRSAKVQMLLGDEFTASPGGASLALNHLIVKNVDHAAINNWATDTPLLGNIASLYGGYPPDIVSVAIADLGYSDPNTGIGSTRQW